jgi:hypothetical protein
VQGDFMKSRFYKDIKKYKKRCFNCKYCEKTSTSFWIDFKCNHIRLCQNTIRGKENRIYFKPPNLNFYCSYWKFNENMEENNRYDNEIIDHH